MSGTIYVAQAGDGTWLASVVELPGCAARGATKDEAVARVRDAFRDYADVLRTRGVSVEHVAGMDPALFAVREPRAPNTFAEDFRGLEEHELRDFLHRFEALRTALLDEVKGLSQADLERRPAAGEWSVREALEHVATANVTILSKLEPWPARDFATLQAVHRVVFQRFSVMEAQDTQGEWRILGREWSVPKVMRRLLEHEYEHLAQIRGMVRRLRGEKG